MYRYRIADVPCPVPFAAAEDVTVQLKSGALLTGRLLEVAPDHVTVDLGRGTATRLERKDVAKLQRDVATAAGADAAVDPVQLDRVARTSLVMALMAERAEWQSRDTSAEVSAVLSISGAAVGLSGLALWFAFRDADNDSDKDKRTAGIVVAASGGVFLGAGILASFFYTSPRRKEQELRRIDDKLSELGVELALVPWLDLHPATGEAGGGLLLSGTM
jgi:hypothetical protein